MLDKSRTEGWDGKGNGKVRASVLEAGSDNDAVLKMV